MLNTSRVTRKPLQLLLIRHGFLQFDQIFRPYIKYCTDQSNCLQYLKERHKDDELFKAYVAWCETQKDCERLRLSDLLVKPMQRVTKYSLLLKAIQKKTDKEDELLALHEMNECVENFVCVVDSTLRQHHERERLASILNRIESYDAIENNNDELEKIMKENGYLTLDLTCPMPGCGNHQIRQLLLEGSGLKLRDSSSSKMDVHCFLFTDLFLICKPVGKKGDKVRIIRQPYLVDKFKVQELKDGGGFVVIYLSELLVAVAAFVLYTSEFKIWIDTIRRAQDLYQEAKRTSKERKGLGFLQANYEDEEEFISTTRLEPRSLRSSSRSSLVHSHSGSVDMSDSISVTSAYGPQNVNQAHNKATSFELGDLRNSSVSSEEGEWVRASSLDTRNGPISVTVTSPRPERRAFFLRGAGSGSSTPNTLSVKSAYHIGDLGDKREHETISPPRSIQVPVISPLAKTLFPSRPPVTSPTSPRVSPRHSHFGHKPPLLKTKNISGLTTHSAPPSQRPSPVHSFESDTVVGLTSSGRTTPDSDDEGSTKLHVRKVARAIQRYNAADCVEMGDLRVQKRPSWNSKQHESCSRGPIGESSRDKLYQNKHIDKCLGSESSHSSSFINSAESVFLRARSSELDPSMEGFDQTPLTDGQRGNEYLQLPTFLLEGDNNGDHRCRISSVQVTVSEESSQERLSREELRKMKEFLLKNWSLKSSDV
ncbi:uncharacterized protein LOC143227830 [Tachypleus tridentatus]|uniref:uncharacterized protein LOC143227830 n=1 Tax=Tachypleus tridentatus TaxID=6853 RepID=UPI003FD43976